MSDQEPRDGAEALWEQLGGDLCICQRPDVPHWCEKCQHRIDLIQSALRGQRSSVASPHAPQPLTPDDCDQIIEGIEHFIIGLDDDPELRGIWQPYIDKLEALKRLAGPGALDVQQDLQAGIGVAARASASAKAVKTCRSCRHLRAFELAPDLFTCSVVNIRLHKQAARVFGCNFHERKPRPRHPRHRAAGA